MGRRSRAGARGTSRYGSYQVRVFDGPTASFRSRAAAERYARERSKPNGFAYLYADAPHPETGAFDWRLISTFVNGVQLWA